MFNLRNIRMSMAVLVAISIPIFTAQLEKSREATDAANIRSAYAEVVAAGLSDPDKDHTATYTVKQKTKGWQSTDLKVAGLNMQDKFANTTSGSTFTITYHKTTADKDEYVSIQLDSETAVDVASDYTIKDGE